MSEHTMHRKPVCVDLAYTFGHKIVATRMSHVDHARMLTHLQAVDAVGDKLVIKVSSLICSY